MTTRATRSIFTFGAIATIVVVVSFQLKPVGAAEPFTTALADWTDSIEQPLRLESRVPGGGASQSAVVRTSHRSAGLFQNECGDSSGTLLQWATGNNVTGGPDLSEPLVTDRPDFTEASSVVGLGVTQLEMGYTFVYNDDRGERVETHSFGEPLLRTGILANWFELRLAVFPLTQRAMTRAMSDATSGVSDVYVGAKIGLTPQDGILPEMALIPQTFMPTGSAGFTSDRWEPGVNWIYAWDVTDCVSTAGSTQFNRRFDESGDAFTAIAQSWTVCLQPDRRTRCVFRVVCTREYRRNWRRPTATLLQRRPHLPDR